MTDIKNRQRSMLLLLGFLAILTVATFTFSEFSNTTKLLAVIGVYMLSSATALTAKLSWKDLGLSPVFIKNSVRMSLPFMFFILIGATILFLINSEIFKDERYQQTVPELLFTIFLVIPFLTVLLEEFIFRGVLFALLSKVLSEKWAIIYSSVAFGLWHVFSASFVTVDSIDSIFIIPKTVIVFAVVIATFTAGLFLAWLRAKSKSLVAPILLHWTINSTGILFAFFAWQ